MSQTSAKKVGLYSAGSGKTEANYAPLSPLSFLPKAAETYPNRIAIIHGEQRRTWSETYTRCRRLASALHKRGIGREDTVAVMAPNVPGIYEAHFGVPDDRRGAEHAEHSARRRSDRLPARAWRSEGADHRPRVQRNHPARAGAAGTPAVGDRH